jgi:hypothetical protein
MSATFYDCSRCDAQFGIAGESSGSDEDYAADDYFDSQVEWHESGKCEPAAASVLEWADPPPTNRGKGGGDLASHLRGAADELRAHPGRWAKVLASQSNPAQAVRLKTGRLVAFRPAGSFEATLRTVGKTPEGKPLYDLYARYVGDPAGATR